MENPPASGYTARVDRSGVVAAYTLPAVSSRRGVSQGLLVLAAAHLIVFVLTGLDFFAAGAALGLGAAFLVAISGAFHLDQPLLMQLIIGAPLYGPFIFIAILTRSVETMVVMAAAGAVLLACWLLLVHDGRAQIGVRGLIVRSPLRGYSLSYDEIAAAQRHKPRLGLLFAEVGFGRPNVEMRLFAGGWKRLYLSPGEVDLFLEDLSRFVEPAEDAEMFFVPAPSQMPAPQLAATATPRRRRAAPPAPAADQAPAAPRSRARVRPPGDAG